MKDKAKFTAVCCVKWNLWSAFVFTYIIRWPTAVAQDKVL